MATSLPPVKIPSGKWINLYAETGISSGTKIIIQNLGDSKVRVSESSAIPTLQSGYNVLSSNEYLTNETSNVGAWAYAHEGTSIQVEEA